MDRGVLTIEPSYSDSDFKITWEDIKEMKAVQRYLITLSDGRRINGTFSSAGEGRIFIDNEEGEDITVDQNEVVNIKSVDSGFLSRLSASIDFGLSMTKANNQRQLNGNLRVGYLEDRWRPRIPLLPACRLECWSRLSPAFQHRTVVGFTSHREAWGR